MEKKENAKKEPKKSTKSNQENVVFITEEELQELQGSLLKLKQWAKEQGCRYF